MYGSGDMDHNRQNVLLFWTIFALLAPPNNSKKTPGDNIILHMCTRSDNHMMYGS